MCQSSLHCWQCVVAVRAQGHMLQQGLGLEPVHARARPPSEPTKALVNTRPSLTRPSARVTKAETQIGDPFTHPSLRQSIPPSARREARATRRPAGRRSEASRERGRRDPRERARCVNPSCVGIPRVSSDSRCLGHVLFLHASVSSGRLHAARARTSASNLPCCGGASPSSGRVSSASAAASPFFRLLLPLPPRGPQPQPSSCLSPSHTGVASLPRVHVGIPRLPGVT